MTQGDPLPLIFCSHHTKVLFLPERAIENITKCDLQTVGERLAHKNGPAAVLHNLGFTRLFMDKFNRDRAKFYE